MKGQITYVCACCPYDCAPCAWHLGCFLTLIIWAFYQTPISRICRELTQMLHKYLACCLIDITSWYSKIARVSNNNARWSCKFMMLSGNRSSYYVNPHNGVYINMNPIQRKYVGNSWSERQYRMSQNNLPQFKEIQGRWLFSSITLDKCLFTKTKVY